MQGAEPRVFPAERFSSLATLPAGGCQAPSSTGCCEIRQGTVCPSLRGNEREWPASWSSLWPETRCASFGTRFPFSLLMPKAASTRADSKSNNWPSRSRSSHLSLPYSMMTATKQSSTRPPDSLHKEASGFRHALWRASWIRPCWGGLGRALTDRDDCSNDRCTFEAAVEAAPCRTAGEGRVRKFDARQALLGRGSMPNFRVRPTVVCKRANLAIRTSASSWQRTHAMSCSCSTCPSQYMSFLSEVRVNRAKRIDHGRGTYGRSLPITSRSVSEK
jgi:hypothetical protein